MSRPYREQDHLKVVHLVRHELAIQYVRGFKCSTGWTKCTGYTGTMILYRDIQTVSDVPLGQDVFSVQVATEFLIFSEYARCKHITNSTDCT
jgi:hypothetical protein